MKDIRNQLLIKDGVSIEKLPQIHCNKCLNRLESGNDKCERCLEPPQYVNDWYFENVKALGIYHQYKKSSYRLPINLLSELILLLKYRKSEMVRNFAGSLLAEGLFKIFKQNLDLYGKVNYLVISPKFKIETDNHVGYMMEPFLNVLEENKYKIRNISNQVRRISDIGKNKDKGYEERFDDIKGVHKIAPMNLEHQDVIILDDIFTTGATSWDLARALKEKNAGKIYVMVAGRHWLFDEWPVNLLYPNGNFSFNYLMNYFSNMDYTMNQKKIIKVDFIDLDLKRNQICGLIEGSKRNYNLKIDLEKKCIEHDCRDFIYNRKRNKKFCKHISKAFLEIREFKDDNYISKLLNSIYRDLDNWQFLP